MSRVSAPGAITTGVGEEEEEAQEEEDDDVDDARRSVGDMRLLLSSSPPTGRIPEGRFRVKMASMEKGFRPAGHVTAPDPTSGVSILSARSGGMSRELATVVFSPGRDVRDVGLIQDTNS